MRSWISRLYDMVSAPVAATRDALAEKLKSVHDTVTLSYNKTKEKLGYGETLKHMVQNEAENEHQEDEEEMNKSWRRRSNTTIV